MFNVSTTIDIGINVKKTYQSKTHCGDITSLKQQKIFWVTLDGAVHGASVSCPMHSYGTSRVTQKIFAVLVK